MRASAPWLLRHLAPTVLLCAATLAGCTDDEATPSQNDATALSDAIPADIAADATTADAPGPADASQDLGAEDTHRPDIAADITADAAADTDPPDVPDPAWAQVPPPTEDLVAGAAERVLGFPVGSSTVGYAPKLGIPTRFVDRYPGTDRQHTPVTAKALVMRQEGKALALVRIDAVGIWHDIVDDARARLREAGRADLADGLIVSATHTHGSGGRIFNHFVGEIAVGSFWPEQFERVVSSLVDTVLDADAATEPARFGYTTLNTALLHSDRRCENPEYQDDMLGVARIDSLDGSRIIGVLVSYSLHGTILGNSDYVLSSDAPGAVEWGVENALSEPAPVLFLQGWAGDMAPHTPRELMTDDGFDLRDGYAELDAIAKAAGEAVAPVLATIETKARPGLDVYSTYFPLDNTLINPDGVFDEYQFGGIYCFNADSNCLGEGDAYTEMGCVPVFEELTVRHSLMSAARIGDLALVTLPGEPMTDVGVTLRDQVQALDGISQAFVMGYGQSYLSYLLFEQDFWQGGYEGASVLMGPGFGAYLVEAAASVAARLLDPEAELSFPVPDIDYGPPKRFDVMAFEEALGDPVIEAQPSSDGPVREATWLGGDPAVDFPVVSVERQEGGEWVPQLRANGSQLSSNGGEIELRLLPEPNYPETVGLAPRKFHWTAALPARFSVPPVGGQYEGTMRFVIEGTRPEAYRIVGEAFELPGNVGAPGQ